MDTFDKSIQKIRTNFLEEQFEYYKTILRTLYPIPEDNLPDTLYNSAVQEVKRNLGLLKETNFSKTYKHKNKNKMNNKNVGSSNGKGNIGTRKEKKDESTRTQEPFEETEI
jgi:hypothetical protein